MPLRSETRFSPKIHLYASLTQSEYCATNAINGFLLMRRTMLRLFRLGSNIETPVTIPFQPRGTRTSYFLLHNLKYLARTIIHHSIQTAASPSALGPSSSSHETSPLPPQASAGPSADGSTRHSFTHQVASSPPFHDLNPANYAPNHDSRRRNAEQRAATLRADPLITQVEPNRVFCSLCHKWVQLRQDSSYCAYPWLQHRGKCLARQ